MTQNVNAEHGLGRRAFMARTVAATAAVAFGTGLLGSSAAWASSVKPVGGVGVRSCKRPGGSSARVRVSPSDSAGRVSIAVAEAGEQSFDVDKAALQMAVNAEAAANRRTNPASDPAARVAVITFAPGLRVTAPGGQTALAGRPGTFVLTSGTQTFVIGQMAAGAVISASVETMDLADLERGIKDQGIKACGRCGVTGRMIPDPSGPVSAPAASRL